MAFQLSLAVGCTTLELAATLQQFLEKETRPIFEDDVKESDQALFLTIEELEYPDESCVEDTDVFTTWLEEDGFTFEDLLPLLKMPGISLLAAYEIPDDPMAADDEEDMSEFWVQQGTGFCLKTEDEAREVIPKALRERLLGR